MDKKDFVNICFSVKGISFQIQMFEESGKITQALNITIVPKNLVLEAVPHFSKKER